MAVKLLSQCLLSLRGSHALTILQLRKRSLLLSRLGCLPKLLLPQCRLCLRHAQTLPIKLLSKSSALLSGAKSLTIPLLANTKHLLRGSLLGGAVGLFSR